MIVNLIGWREKKDHLLALLRYKWSPSWTPASSRVLLLSNAIKSLPFKTKLGLYLIFCKKEDKQSYSLISACTITVALLHMKTKDISYINYVNLIHQKRHKRAMNYIHIYVPHANIRCRTNEFLKSIFNYCVLGTFLTNPRGLQSISRF